MVKGLQRIALWLLGLLVAYLLVVRILLSFVQLMPETATSTISGVLGGQTSYDKLHLDQNLLGFDLVVENLEFQSVENRVSIEYLAMDFNLFAPFIPKQPFGNRLALRNAVIRHASPDNEAEESQTQFPLYKLWRSIQFESVHFATQKETNWYHFKVDEFSAYSGTKWSFGGRFGFYIGQEASPSWSKVQLYGDLISEFQGGEVSGRLAGSILEPIQVASFRSVLPATWQSLISQAGIVGDFKADIKQNQISNLTINSGLQAIEWPEEQTFNPNSIHLSLDWVDLSQSLVDKQAWVFKLSNIRFDNDYVSNTSPVYVSLDGDNLAFSVQKLDEALLKPFLSAYLASQGQKDVAQRFESAELHKLEGKIDLFDLYLSRLNAEIKNFKLSAGEKAPGLSFPQLVLKKQDDLVSLTSPSSIVLDVPNYQKFIFTFDSAQPFQFTLDPIKDWQLQKQRVIINDVVFFVTGSGHNVVYQDISLQAKFSKLKQVKSQLPYYVMSEKLTSWLKSSLKGGDSVELDFSIKGNAFSGDFWKQGTGYLATAKVNNAHLMFDKKWPAFKKLDAIITYKNRDLIISAKKTALQGVSLADVEVYLKNIHSMKGLGLRIKGLVSTKIEQAKQFMLTTPVARMSSTTELLESIETYRGDVQVDINSLWIPLEKEKDASINGSVNFKEVAARFYRYFLVEDIKGQLNFSDKGVSSNGIKGLFHNGDAVAKIKTLNETKEVKVSIVGQTEYQDNPFLEGKVFHQTEILAGKDEAKIIFDVDLKSMESKLPAPLDEKTMLAQLNRPSSVHGELDISNGDVFTNVTFENMLNIKGVRSGENGDFGDWQLLQLNTEKLTNPVPLNAKAGSGVRLDFGFDYLDLDGWVDIYPEISDRLNAMGLTSDEPMVWKAASIRANKLKALGAMFNQVKVSWLHLPTEHEVKQVAETATAEGIADSQVGLGDFVIQVNGEEIDLSIKQTGDSFVVRSEKFYFQTSDELKKDVEAAADDVTNRCELNSEINGLPNIDFVATDVVINDSKMNSLQFTLTDEENELKVDKLQGSFGKYGTFYGDYRYNKSKNTSSLKSKMSSKRTQDIVDFLGVKKGLAGKKAKVTLDLNWKGQAECFSLIKTKGHLKFRFEEGEIKDAEPGIARLIGFLSVDSLARRLQLDMKDMSSKGLFYDSIKGKGRFQRGIFGIEELSLKAPSADASVFGEVNLIQSSVNLSADITPAIGSTLPAVAAISGVATPIAGLAVYALMKAVPAINEDLVTYRYEVKGPVDNPKVKDRGLELDLLNVQTPVHEDILEQE